MVSNRRLSCWSPSISWNGRLEETTGLATKAAAKSKEPKTKIPAGTVFQFKITLQGIKPPIWRRIQTKDCTLDKFHEHIQTAMGWTNSHLHQFKIGGVIYGDPELLYEGWEDETPPVEFAAAPN